MSCDLYEIWEGDKSFCVLPSSEVCLNCFHACAEGMETGYQRVFASKTPPSASCERSSRTKKRCLVASLHLGTKKRCLVASLHLEEAKKHSVDLYSTFMGLRYYSLWLPKHVDSWLTEFNSMINPDLLKINKKKTEFAKLHYPKKEEEDLTLLYVVLVSWACLSSIIKTHFYYLQWSEQCLTLFMWSLALFPRELFMLGNGDATLKPLEWFMNISSSDISHEMSVFICPSSTNRKWMCRICGKRTRIWSK